MSSNSALIVTQPVVVGDPKSDLRIIMNDILHSLTPSQGAKLVFREGKRLHGVGQFENIAHFYEIIQVGPQLDPWTMGLRKRRTTVIDIRLDSLNYGELNSFYDSQSGVYNLAYNKFKAVAKKCGLEMQMRPFD